MSAKLCGYSVATLLHQPIEELKPEHTPVFGLFPYEVVVQTQELIESLIRE